MPDDVKYSQLEEFEQVHSIEGSKKKSPSKSAEKISLPSKPMKKFKTQAAPETADAIQHLNRIAHNAAEENPYDQFGKYVAAELRQLPQRPAIFLQQEIQMCITRSKLSCLEPVHSAHPDYTEQLNVDVLPSTSK